MMRERWVLLVLGLVFGVTGAGAHAFLATEQYSASTTFFIATTDLGESTVTSAYQGSLLSEQKIKSYTELATGRRMQDQIEDVLGEPLGDGAIAASARPDTVLLTISVTDPSPTRAQRVAQIAATEFVALVADVETPGNGGTPAVAAKIVQTAQLPAAPVSPKPIRDIALGVVLGLMLGVGMAVLRHTLDRTVKSTELLSMLVEAPVLGVTIHDVAAKNNPLVMVDAPQSPLAESFRQLRTSLQYVDLDNQSKLIVVTSALPGEGKTTTSVNLAIAVAQGGARVAVVEADLRRPKAAQYLGMDNTVGLTSVLTGQVGLDTALQPWGDGMFDFLGSGPLPPNPSELLASRQMTDVLDELALRYDMVIFDAPPTLPVADAAVLAARCHGALFVARHGKVTQDQVRAAGDTLSRVSANIFGVILTMAPASKRAGGYGYEYSYSSTGARAESAVRMDYRNLRTPRGRKAIEAQQAARLSEAEGLIRGAQANPVAGSVNDWPSRTDASGSAEPSGTPSAGIPQPARPAPALPDEVGVRTAGRSAGDDPGAAGNRVDNRVDD